MAEYAYTKLRSEFGRMCTFTDRPADVLANIRPSDQLAADYMHRNPVHRGVQINSFQHYSERYVTAFPPYHGRIWFLGFFSVGG